MHICKVHAHEIHAYEMHACKMHACKMHVCKILSEWGSGVNGLLELSTAGELYSYIDTPEMPRMSCICSERAESVQDRLYLSRIDRTHLE